MAKKFILFDLDGTLTDSRPGILEGVAYAMTEVGYPITADKVTTNVIGPPIADCLRAYYGFSVEEANRALAIYREYYKKGALFNNNLYEGVIPMLKALKEKGLSLYLATGKPLCFSVPICERFGIAPFMTDFFATGLDGSYGDKPSLLAHILQTCNLKAEDGVMVGDRRYDMEGASANRMDSVGVLWGYGDREELQSAGATYFAKDAKELTEILLSL